MLIKLQWIAFQNNVLLFSMSYSTPLQWFDKSHLNFQITLTYTYMYHILLLRSHRNFQSFLSQTWVLLVLLLQHMDWMYNLPTSYFIYSHISYYTYIIYHIVLNWFATACFRRFLTGWTFVVVINAARWMYHLHLLTLAYLHLHLLTSVNTCHLLLCNVQPFPLQAFLDALVVAARWIYHIALYYFATTHSLFLHRRCCCCNALDVSLAWSSEDILV